LARNPTRKVLMASRKMINKRIDYVQTALKIDAKSHDRPLNKFTELVFLIGDQFDDLNNIPSLNVVVQKQN